MKYGMVWFGRDPEVLTHSSISYVAALSMSLTVFFEALYSLQSSKSILFWGKRELSTVHEEQSKLRVAVCQFSLGLLYIYFPINSHILLFLIAADFYACMITHFSVKAARSHS